MIPFDDDERRRRLALRHGLASSLPQGVVGIADALTGLHSSDPTSVHLSAWARIPGFALADMETALYDDRTLVRVLGMRGTLFVVPTDVAPLLQHGCAAKRASSVHRRLVTMLEEGDVAEDGESWIERVGTAVEAALANDGPMTASELTERVPELGARVEVAPDKPYGGMVGMSTRLLFLLAMDGRIARGRPRGTWASSLYEWALLDDWAPAAGSEVPAEQARQQLAERWLRTFGPALVSDLEWWSAWGKRATAKALAGLDTKEVELDNGPGVVLADDLDLAADVSPWAALLPGLDPTVMGWKTRDWYLGEHTAALFDRNGNAGPTIWWNGRVVGGWSQRPDGVVVHRLLEDVGSEARTAIEAKVSELQTWLGERTFVTRFRTPLEKELFAS